MQQFPLFFNLQNKPVLVIGGGDVALRKVQSMMQAGANVTVVAPDFHPSLRALKNKQVSLIEAEFKLEHLAEQRLVIAATDNMGLNQRVYSACDGRGIWVNVVDQPDYCQFTFPSIIDRDPVTIAISTNGKAPVLGRLLREKLERMIPQWTGRLAEQAGKFRSKVKRQITDFQSRRHFWERVFRGRTSQMAALGDWQGVDNQLERELDNSAEPQVGQVYLTGGGPGDPELLTVRALQTMQMADVIVYDALISQPILALCRKDAEMISVGKKAGNHSLPQQQINQLLVDLASTGKVVCRLKGGDPYIFGRGGEEAELLAKHNIPFQVVPGITAASACSASSGIPLTHRDYAQSVQFITGHCKNSDGVAGAGSKESNQTSRPNWKALAQSRQTLVIYMGVIRSQVIKQNLIANGRCGETPVAIIEKGTRPDQRVVTSTLDQLDTLVARHQIGSPALIIIGEVVALHQVLAKADESQLAQLTAAAIDTAA